MTLRLLKLSGVMKVTRCGFGNTPTATGRPSGRFSRRSLPPAIRMRTTQNGRPSRPGRCGSRLHPAKPSSHTTDRGARDGEDGAESSRSGLARRHCQLHGRRRCAGPWSRARARRVRTLLGQGAGLRCDAVQCGRGIEPRRRATRRSSDFRSLGLLPRPSHTQPSAALVCTSCTGPLRPIRCKSTSRS